ncbi:MAG: transcription-repair coupling factor [Deltaproteobacteria bacterium]|nr:transcription-repair coupling factor [Deltaproteobacteria bacterium]
MTDAIKDTALLLSSAAPLAEVEGFFGASRGYILARLLNETDAPPLLVIEPTPEEAETLLDDLRFFLGSSDEGPFEVPDGVLYFPAEEALPYDGAAFSSGAAMQRASTLFHLTQRDWPARLVVTSVQALARQTLPPRMLARHSEIVARGEAIDRDRFLSALVSGGYAQVQTCEDPGTYAVRGGTIDLFVPQRPLPVRIELFGDEVEFLREFDPKTQRAGRTIDEVRFGPIREVVLDAETVERALERLSALADSVDYPTRKLRVIKEELESRLSFFGVEAYMPALYESLETLGDYVKARGFVWLWDRRARCLGELDQIHAAAQSGYESALRDHKLHFSPERHHQNAAQLAHLAGKEIDAVAQSDAPALRYDYGDLGELVARLSVSRAAPNVRDHYLPLAEWLKQRARAGDTHLLAVGSLAQAERTKELLSELKVDVRIDKTPFTLARLDAVRELDTTLVVVLGELEKGFADPTEQLVFLAETDVFGHRSHVQRKRHQGTGEFINDLKELKEGDLLVHVDHGVGRFQGLQRLAIRGVEEDYLHLEYAGADKLYLPVYRINLVQRYAGQGAGIKLDKLGGTLWETKKQRVKDAVLAMAHDLLDLYAKRELAKAVQFPPAGPELREFEAAFPFDETPDQEKAISEVLSDLQRSRPMDRLICGDVGFGKTEVAIRAAYYATIGRGQVAVLVPTTVLAEQHHRTFSERLANTPITVEVISRFREPKEQKDILKRLESGGVDILIGTHRLLSDDVRFKNLGLVIIDEEQRFGVKHKEKLRKLRSQAHVLTLSATPIPRTLQMSFLGIRDLSLIATPPVDRHAIRTQVTKFDEDVIRDAIVRELSRGGQVFFVHNRVQSIASMGDYIKRVVPEARIAVAHGQMDPQKLEEVMVGFVERKTNVLITTTIIESGIDIPSVNTMIVNRADAFGLSQLHQLRGRIGRSAERAYAVLLVPKSDKVTKDAHKRLEALQRFSELGSGFKIASHDLDIRGAGNLLGPDQSGHIAAVGFELYTELLQQAVAELKGGLSRNIREPEIRLPVTALIPEKYVADTSLRLNYYKRMAQAESDDQVYDVLQELSEFYGEPPDAVERLTQVMILKRRLVALGATALDGAILLGPKKEAAGGRLAFVFDKDAPIDRAKLVDLATSTPERARLTPDGKLVYTFSAKEVREPEDLLDAAKALLNQLLSYVPAAPALEARTANSSHR